MSGYADKQEFAGRFLTEDYLYCGVKYVKELPIRKYPRLKAYDYNQNGAYFITFCVKGRHEMLGRIVGRDAPGAPCVELSGYGKTIAKEIEDIPSHYQGVYIEKYVVMPNHVHMIIIINRDDGAPRAARPTAALIPSVLAIIKRKSNKLFGFDMWQTSFHDHIIRDEADYQRIWQYIDQNPARWREDRYFSMGT